MYLPNQTIVLTGTSLGGGVVVGNTQIIVQACVMTGRKVSRLIFKIRFFHSKEDMAICWYTFFMFKLTHPTTDAYKEGYSRIKADFSVLK